jgi:hypothetical protein
MSILQLSNYCHYALQYLKILEIAFVHLRYFLGGHRPSQTTSHKMSFKKISKIKIKGWYFTDAFKLPPILHKKINFTT